MKVELSGFKIKRVLGYGEIARVYLAFEKKLKRNVALKILRPSFAEDRKVYRRFIKEARTAAQLHHSNIITIYDVEKQKDLIYISMEYLKESLKTRLKKSPTKIKSKDALFITKEIAKALAFAHKKGFIHRDVKPDNIMFREDGVVVLVDFGIVKALSTNTKLTQTGYSLGTPHYMSPEQIQSSKIDGRADIYSLGIVLYEMLVGHVPYQEIDFHTIARKHIQSPIPKLPKRFKDFQPLIDKMLEKNPKKRIKNAEGVIRLIDAFNFKLKTETTDLLKKSQTTHKYRKRSKKSIKSFFRLIIILLIIGILIYFSINYIKGLNKKKEESSWGNAQSINTIESYNQYLNKYPEGSYKDSATNKIETIKDKEKKYQKYRDYYIQAEKYFEQGDYNKALQKIDLAKKTKNTEELNKLEKKVKANINELNNNEYMKHFHLALKYFKRGDFNAAQENLKKAKRIKQTDELRLLEQKIKNEIQK